MINDDILTALNLVTELMSKSLDGIDMTINLETGFTNIRAYLDGRGAYIRFNANEFQNVPKPNNDDPEFKKLMRYLEGILNYGK